MVVTCEQCGKTFEKEFYLKRHKSRKYPCYSSKECIYCGKDFGELTQLQKKSHNNYCRKKHNNKPREVKKEENVTISELVIEIKQLKKELKELKSTVNSNALIKKGKGSVTNNNVINLNINNGIVVKHYDGSRGKSLLSDDKTLLLLKNNRADSDFLPKMVKEAHIEDENNRNIRPQSKAKATEKHDWETMDEDGHFLRLPFSELVDTWIRQGTISLEDVALNNENLDENVKRKVEKLLDDASNMMKGYNEEEMDNMKRTLCRMFYNAVVKGQVVCGAT